MIIGLIVIIIALTLQYILHSRGHGLIGFLLAEIIIILTLIGGLWK